MISNQGFRRSRRPAVIAEKAKKSDTDVDGTRAQKESSGKASTELAIADKKMPSDAGRETRRTIAGCAWVKIPAKIVNIEVSGWVAATVADEKARKTWDRNAEMIENAEVTGSRDEQDRIDGCGERRRLVAVWTTKSEEAKKCLQENARWKKRRPSHVQKPKLETSAAIKLKSNNAILHNVKHHAHWCKYVQI